MTRNPGSSRIVHHGTSKSKKYLFIAQVPPIFQGGAPDHQLEFRDRITTFWEEGTLDVSPKVQGSKSKSRLIAQAWSHGIAVLGASGLGRGLGQGLGLGLDLGLGPYVFLWGP